MVKIHKNVMELIGKTPLVELSKIEKDYQIEGRLLAKLEYMNPAGSIKDRTAKAMIEDAERKGLLKPGATIIEPTSGNTGIGLALVSAIKGYHLILTMPETMSEERRNLLKIYGAEIVLTPGDQGMSGAIEKAKELVKETKGSFMPSQFENPANAAIHLKTTGPEVWMDTDGRMDIFVGGVGTGGTITGVGEYLKSMFPDVHIVAVEPETSAVLSGKAAGKHVIQGIGAGFVPELLNTEAYDEVFPVDNESCFRMGRELAQKEGIVAGISSGAAVYAAVQVARRPENQGKTVVVILPDSGDRYYSTPLFQEP